MSQVESESEQLPELRLPTRSEMVGPITRARLQRTLRGYGALFILGAGLALYGSQQWAALGLGLMAPGGGFLLYLNGGVWSVGLHLALFVGTGLLFAMGLFLWAATGNIVAPVVVWIGAALYAASMDHEGAVHGHHGSVPLWEILTSEAHDSVPLNARVLLPTVLMLLALDGWRRWRRREAWLRSERTRINSYLATAETPAVTPEDAATRLAQARALNPADFALWRFLLDRALQPVNSFEGFDRIDEFREAAKRYQICNLSYMLSMDQYVRMPAFRGYLHEAQQRLALKMMDHKVWSYWRIENAWGNFSLDPNPLARDNIMYYGWYGGMLGMQLRNTGDQRWCGPGSIRLQHPGGKEYRTSFGEICALLERNMRHSDFCLFPCEPRWIYPVCNGFGALALKAHDLHFGTDLWARVESRYRKGLEDEFITLNGRITAIRDNHTGLTIPALTATMADAVTALFLHPLFPDIARRSWTIIRHDLIRVAHGEIKLTTNGWDNIDFGNYRRTMISTYALIAATAREMGDDEVADLLLQRIDAEYPHTDVAGVRHYHGASVSSHSTIHAARVLRSHAFHDLMVHGMPAALRDGPLLAEARYPDVLVAGATSDGAALWLQLAPGADKGRKTLGLAQLVPGRRYAVEGAVQRELVADEQGRADLLVDLDGLQTVRVRPTN